MPIQFVRRTLLGTDPHTSNIGANCTRRYTAARSGALVYRSRKKNGAGSDEGSKVMQIGGMLELSPQTVTASLIAAPMLLCGVRLSLLVAWNSAWYARRWQTPTDEDTPNGHFLTDRLFSTIPYGILAAPTMSSAATLAGGGSNDDDREA